MTHDDIFKWIAIIYAIGMVVTFPIAYNARMKVLRSKPHLTMLDIMLEVGLKSSLEKKAARECPKNQSRDAEYSALATAALWPFTIGGVLSGDEK